MRTQLLRWSDRPQHLCVKSVLVAGSLLLLLTAIFPERYDADGQLLSQSLEAISWLYLGYISAVSRRARRAPCRLESCIRLYSAAFATLVSRYSRGAPKTLHTTGSPPRGWRLPPT